MNILDEILARKRRDVAEAKRRQPSPTGRGGGPDFRAALGAVPFGLVAEVKRKSPSAGPIREPFDPADIARAYERSGAQAVSVLMDEPFFGGGEKDFSAVRAAVRLPLLYKEFVVDPWQIFHAASLGASAVLLIVAALEKEELTSLAGVVQAAGMTPLVEVHDAAELKIALASGADVIGINNRNLRTFQTTLQTSILLAPSVPREVMLVSESGIRTADDVRRLQDAGVHAMLVGESLLRQPDIEAAVRGLRGGIRGR